LFELTIFGTVKYDYEIDIKRELLPKSILGKIKRKYWPIGIIEFKFRSTPEKVGGHHRYSGKVEVTFTSYSLNEDEIATLKRELEKDDDLNAMSFIEGATGESLTHIAEEVEDFLEDKKVETKEKEEKGKDTNPFSALFSFL